MPKRDDIKSVLVIGSGPIVIGQACEFDYSGTQACRVLREEGVRVILVNSNPATIMTDPDFADATYIEPITWQVIETIIAKERPDAILPTLGGQTALNAAIDLHNHGFAVDAPLEGSFDSPNGYGRVEVSHVGLNDDVVEGLRALDIPAFSVQYHPEAAAGPHDANYLFDRFRDMVIANLKDAQ